MTTYCLFSPVFPRKKLVKLLSLPDDKAIQYRLPPKRRQPMPYVNIKITREGATPEQKAELIRGATELLRTVLNKNPATTVVVIDEVETDSWGIGGETVTVRRKRGS
jgi:4-oxalocrotonate tautomerase